MILLLGPSLFTGSDAGKARPPRREMRSITSRSRWGQHCSPGIHCTHGNDARAIVFSSVLEVTTSSYRCCLDLYRLDIFTPASIFWGYIEKMRFPGGLVSEIWELQWEIGTMRMRESVRVGACLPSAACSYRPERKRLIRSSVQCKWNWIFSKKKIFSGGH